MTLFQCYLRKQYATDLKKATTNTWLKEKTFLSIPNPFSFSPAAVEVEDTSNPVFGKETPLIIKLTVHYKSLRQSKI